MGSRNNPPTTEGIEFELICTASESLNQTSNLDIVQSGRVPGRTECKSTEFTKSNFEVQNLCHCAYILLLDRRG